MRLKHRLEKAEKALEPEIEEMEPWRVEGVRRIIEQYRENIRIGVIDINSDSYKKAQEIAAELLGSRKKRRRK